MVDGDRVRWVGTVHGDQRDTLVATADAALFPIDWDEPGGTAVVESLALGTAVIGYQRGCLPELVEHGHTGLLMTPGDQDQLADAITKASIINPQHCRQEATRRFTPGRMADQYLKLYDRILDRSGQTIPLRAMRRNLKGDFGSAPGTLHASKSWCGATHCTGLPTSPAIRRTWCRSRPSWHWSSRDSWQFRASTRAIWTTAGTPPPRAPGFFLGSENYDNRIDNGGMFDLEVLADLRLRYGNKVGAVAPGEPTGALTLGG